MQAFWNQRYAGDEFVYGEAPNTFLAEHAAELAGPVLSVAEGEGRNAVHLASLGLDVLGVDQSDVGLAKARQLAARRGVSIRTEVADLLAYAPPENHFGALVSIWAHLPGDRRRAVHRALERGLRPGGIVLLEAYAKAQLARNTGGPKDGDRLMAAADLPGDFPHCEVILCRETVRDVTEGPYHNGPADVVQFIARKRG